MSDTNFDKFLADIRDYICSLQEKNSIADRLVASAQKIQQTNSTLKEYREEVSAMNKCWRPTNRNNNSMANFRAEDRTLMSLREENRQIKCSLEEMETALHLLMQKHRRLIVDFARTEKLMKLWQSTGNESSIGKLDEAKFIEFLQLVEGCMRKAEEQFCIDAETIARYRNENATLRELLRIARADMTRSSQGSASDDSLLNVSVTGRADAPIIGGFWDETTPKLEDNFPSGKIERTMPTNKIITSDDLIPSMKHVETKGTTTIPNTEEMVENTSEEKPVLTENGDGEERLLNFIIRTEVSHSK